MRIKHHHHTTSGFLYDFLWFLLLRLREPQPCSLQLEIKPSFERYTKTIRPNQTWR